jgi:hypothetical protein
VIARVLGTVALGLLATGALAGCNATKLEDSSVERLIAGYLADQGFAGARVDCPEVANEVGERFTCAITNAGGHTEIPATVARNDRIALGRLR